MISTNVYTEKVNGEIDKKLETKLNRAGEIGRQTAYDLSRVDTSRMRNSTEYEVEKNGDSLDLILGQGNRQVIYAKFQELGTKHFEGTHHVKKGLIKAVEEFKK